MSFTTTIERRESHTSIISLSPSKRRKVEPAIEPEPLNSNELWKWTLSSEAIAPCFIKDAMNMKENPTKDDFYWLGRVPCRTVHIVGVLVGVQIYEKRIRYTVDDGTEVIDCLHKQSPPPRSPVKKPPANKASFLQPQPPETPKPVARVGSPVSVVGRVVRKFDTREIVADTIAKCPSANDEARHWLTVHRLHRENYSLSTPFKIPECPASPVKLTSNVGPSTPTRSTAPSAKVAPIAGSSSGMPIYVGTTPTSSKLNTPSTTHTVSPSSSSQASSPAKSNAPNSPQRLRHPSRLHSRDLNGNTFRIYVKHYMDRTAYIDSTPEADYEPDIPEPPSSPSKRSFQLANDTTPRPSASRVSMSMQTPRPRIPPLSYDGHPPPRASAVARGSPGMKCFTLSYLRRVPELADMAQRVVKAVTKRRLREERQKAKEAAAVAASVSRSSSSTHPSTSSRTSTSSTQTEGKSGPRIKRLFQATIVQLLREGSIVLWDGPTHTCPTADVPKEQTSGLWKANLTSVSADSTVFSTTSVSMAGDDEEELVLSDPEANEEAYVPLSPGFLAGVVEEAIGKLTRALKVFDARKGKEVTKCGTTTKEGILAHLRKDDRWRYLSEWNIGEALDVLKAERRAWCVGRGLWELRL